VTSNGKLDRRALPAPEQDAMRVASTRLPGEIEEVLRYLARTAAVERVGRQDNFFELGGHSLLIVQMMERLRRVGLSAEVRVYLRVRLGGPGECVEPRGGRAVCGAAESDPAECEMVTPQMLPLLSWMRSRSSGWCKRYPGSRQHPGYISTGAAAGRDPVPSPVESGGWDTYVVRHCCRSSHKSGCES